VVYKFELSVSVSFLGGGKSSSVDPFRWMDKDRSAGSHFGEQAILLTVRLTGTKISIAAPAHIEKKRKAVFMKSSSYRILKNAQRLLGIVFAI
jgi:hypothetical protein